MTTNEVFVYHTSAAFQEEYDDYVAEVSALLNSDQELDDNVRHLLKTSLRVSTCYLNDLKELDTYRRKFTPVPPRDVEMSTLKKCHIGKCECGQLLIESRDKCCPKCKQFVDWSCKFC